MKKILTESQRQYILLLAKKGGYAREVELLSMLASVDEAEKRLAELEPPDLRTEEITFKVTYDANVILPNEAVKKLQDGLKGLPFTRVDLILPGPEDIIASPGEGFRWLDEDKDILQEGDQFMRSYTEGWVDTSLAGHEVFTSYFYRRRLSKEIL